MYKLQIVVACRYSVVAIIMQLLYIYTYIYIYIFYIYSIYILYIGYCIVYIGYCIINSSTS